MSEPPVILEYVVRGRKQRKRQRRTKRFDPNQPRDPHTGEWVETEIGMPLASPRVTPTTPKPPVKGRSVGENFDIPKKGKVHDGVMAAFEAIDSVLTLPELPHIPIKPSGGKQLGGSYVRAEDADGNLVPTKIKITSDRPTGAFPHELGHMIDDQLFGIPFPREGKPPRAIFGSFAAFSKHRIHQGEPSAVWDTRQGDPDPNLVDLMVEITDSPTVKDLGTASMYEYAACEYMSRPHEAFARAFFQWVAIRSGDPRMIEALNNERDLESQIDRAVDLDLTEQRKYHYFRDGEEAWVAERRQHYREHPDSLPKILRDHQWPDDEFEPIAARFDKLFGDLGWLKT